MHLTEEPILLGKFFSFSSNPSCGATASFVGMVRDHDEGKRVKKLYYECYPSMADKMIGQLITEASDQWNINEIRVLHRVGTLEIGDVAVAIAVSSAHREEAFQGCRFLIERLKLEVPIWKKQIFEDGTNEWAIYQHSNGVGATPALPAGRRRVAQVTA